jgi:hypothetical protein
VQVNTTQRNLLILASAILAFFLFVEIREEDFEDSHWILVTILVAGLLFVAFSSKEKARPKSAPIEITKEKLADNQGDEGKEIVNIRFDECVRRWTEFFKSSLVDRKPKLTIKDRSDLEPIMQLAAIKMAYANYLFIIAHRSADALNDEDARHLRMRAGGLLTRRLRATFSNLSKIIPDAQIPNGPNIARVAEQQIAEYEQLVRQCQEGFRRETPLPLDPIFASVDEEVKFQIGQPAAREAFFGIKFREETGRLLHPQAGISATD